MTLDDTDLAHLRRCVELAREGLADGDEPFGSVLVDAAGVVRFEDRNRVKDGDETRHPEFEIAKWSASHLTAEERAGATVYTSGEHCPMCSAAHGWMGLGRIVYAVSSAQLGEWLSEWGVPPGPVRPLPVQDVAPGVPVDGPAPELADEMRALHHELQRRPREVAMRALVALGGNAMTGADGGARVEDQQAAAEVAMKAVADLIAEGVEVVLTHGNGPQVGNLLVKNEIAASVVPPVPLDWCGAQTQATLGFTLMNALEAALAARGVQRGTATVVTRTLVARDDEGFARPTKPIGRFLPAEEAAVLVEHGEIWEDRGEKGWRRLVASPEPLEIVDGPAALALVDDGFVVVANGGGGIPVIRDLAGRLHGVEAVIDKDLGAALLARTVAADVLVIATDVPHAVLRYGTPEAQDLGTVSVTELRGYAAEGHFASGSMGPKVDAACRFVEHGGVRAVITSLDHIVAAVAGEAGTVVVPA